MKIAFRPKLLDCLPGYNREQFGKDLAAGITVGVLALPLAMAFAIASGVSPAAGIWTAIIAGRPAPSSPSFTALLQFMATPIFWGQPCSPGFFYWRWALRAWDR
jgi:Sulfate permease family